MKILAVLQNMWVKDPVRVREILLRHPQARRRMIVSSLFAGCATGRILKKVFGDDCPNRFTWDESTREIAGNPRDVYKADLEHLRQVLFEESPDIVIGFGRIACGALQQLVDGQNLIICPHPTARQADTLPRLQAAASCLENMVQHRGASQTHVN